MVQSQMNCLISSDSSAASVTDTCALSLRCGNSIDFLSNTLPGITAHVSVTEAALESEEIKQFICDWTIENVVHRGTERATVRRRLKATRTYIEVEEELR